jgi:hypothetical protein
VRIKEFVKEFLDARVVGHDAGRWAGLRCLNAVYPAVGL